MLTYLQLLLGAPVVVGQVGGKQFIRLSLIQTLQEQKQTQSDRHTWYIHSFH